MFILDLYNFCESRRGFTRQDLSKFIFEHRDCERFARHSNMTAKALCILAAKEFIARHCTLGYLDFDGRTARVRRGKCRPFSFEFNTLNGPGDRYVKMMANIGNMTDDEIFGRF